jgi:ABC-type antimicrobial peptide transport system permease subunit
VSQRAREIGIRTALGEPAARVRRRVVARTLALADVGVAAGLGVVLAAARLIGALLYDVGATDVATFAANAPRQRGRRVGLERRFRRRCPEPFAPEGGGVRRPWPLGIWRTSLGRRSYAVARSSRGEHASDGTRAITARG